MKITITLNSNLRASDEFILNFFLCVSLWAQAKFKMLYQQTNQM